MKHIFPLALLLSLGLSLGAHDALAQDRIYSINDTVDNVPLFPGGEDIMREYFAEKIPQGLLGEEVPVVCTFVITPYCEIEKETIECWHLKDDGSFEALNRMSPYERALVRVVEEIPGFIPADIDGESVYYRYVLALNTELPKQAPIVEKPVIKRSDSPALGTSAPTSLPKNERAYDGERVYAGERLFTMWDRLEKRPEYPGGTKGMLKAINANLKRPHVYSHQKNIYCAFVVKPNGEIDQSTIKCLHKHPDGRYKDVPQYTVWEEVVMDAVKHLDSFSPAKADGRRVPYFLIVPVTFK